MKRIIAGGFIAVLLLSGGSSAYAEEGKGMEVEAGIKWWCNQWKRSGPGGLSERSKRAPLIGPVVEAALPSGIFAEASYLFTGKEYKFDVPGELPVKVERGDIDLAVGYKITHDVGVFVGYRHASFKDKEAGEKEAAYGPQAGFRGTIPVGERFAIIGSFIYLAGRFKEEGPLFSNTEKNPGWVAELGGKYTFTDQVSASLAYQEETARGKETHVRDTFAGLSLRVMYAFE